ncbi:MAG TPA: hypothetical protein PLB70_01965, partial [Paludibacteraceae bacterium]|nr:hypothetical protein [Paludibacteraceae bacterium]
MLRSTTPNGTSNGFDAQASSAFAVTTAMPLSAVAFSISKVAPVSLLKVKTAVLPTDGLAGHW